MSVRGNQCCWRRQPHKSPSERKKKPNGKHKTGGWKWRWCKRHPEFLAQTASPVRVFKKRKKKMISEQSVCDKPRSTVLLVRTAPLVLVSKRKKGKRNKKDDQHQESQCHHLYIHIYEWTYIHTCIYKESVDICVYIYVYVFTCICARVCVCEYICIYIFTWACVFIYIYI